VISRARHLQEERLFESYLAVREGESLDPRVAEHLSDCRECRTRYSDLTEFMDRLSSEAIAETDAIFTPERLRTQQQLIARRLEHLGHPARVITFPGRSAGHHFGSTAPRGARRWIAASVAAGLFIGVATGMVLDRQSRSTLFPVDRVAVSNRFPPPLASVTTIVQPDPAEGDEAFLSEIEIAGQRPRIGELLAVDAITPHAREITLR